MGKLHESLRINHLDNFKHRSAVAETTDFFKGQCVKG